MLGPSRSTLSRQLERERARNHAREAELVNQILYLSGRTWQPPPAPDEDAEKEQPAYVSALDVMPHEWDEQEGQE